jgi:hypothetical protein
MFEVVVIGGGPAGVTAALRARDFAVFAEEMLARVVLGAEEPALWRLRSVVRGAFEAEPDLSRVVPDFWSAGTSGAEDGAGVRCEDGVAWTC